MSRVSKQKTLSMDSEPWSKPEDVKRKTEARLKRHEEAQKVKAFAKAEEEKEAIKKEVLTTCYTVLTS